MPSGVGVAGTGVSVGVGGTGVLVEDSTLAVGVAGTSEGGTGDVDVGVGVALGRRVAVGALAVRVANIRSATVASTATMSGVGSVRAQPASVIATKMDKVTNKDFMIPSARIPSAWYSVVISGRLPRGNRQAAKANRFAHDTIVHGITP